MTQKRYTEIPKRQKCINKEEPYIGGAVDIVDDTNFPDNPKPQSQVNQERIEQEATLDGKIAAEKQRAEGVEGGLDERLGTVEQLAEISIGGGDAQIATGSDFTNPDATKRAKIPTVGAIVDGLNDGVYDVSKRNPTAGPNSDGKFTLDYILSNADALIPTGWRHGGMTISFVDRSDNKYVQYLYKETDATTVATFTNTDNWEKVNLEKEVNQVNQIIKHIDSNRIDGTLKEGDIEQFPIFEDGKYYVQTEYAIAPTQAPTYSAIVINDISGGDVIDIKLDYAIGSRVYNAYFIFAATNTESAINSSYIANYVELIDDTEHIYRLTAPNGTTKIFSACMLSNKGIIAVKKQSNKKVLRWLDIIPQQIEGEDIIFSSSTITPTFTSGLYKSEQSDKSISSVSSPSTSLIEINDVIAGDTYDIIMPYAISSSLWNNYFIFAVTDSVAAIPVSEIENYVKLIDNDSHLYRMTVPVGTTKILSAVTTSDAFKIVVKKVVVKKELKWLFINSDNLDPAIQQSFIDKIKNEEKEYHLYDSIKRPFIFSGKSMVAFGDSITFGLASPGSYETQDSYIRLFASYAGISNLDVQAVSGASISRRYDFDIYNQVTNYTEPADIIWVAGGINDWASGRQLGIFGSTDTSTVYGALKGICEYIKTNYPNATVIFVTPLSCTSPDSSWPNHIAPLNEYRTAIYDVATYYGYNVINGLGLGMPQSRGTYSDLIIADTCHPTEIGHALYARNLCGKLL